MEPDQPNACGRFAALALADGARPAERLRRRWILPSLTVDFVVAYGGFVAAAAARPAERLRPFCCPRPR